VRLIVLAHKNSITGITAFTAICGRRGSHCLGAPMDCGGILSPRRHSEVVPVSGEWGCLGTCSREVRRPTDKFQSRVTDNPLKNGTDRDSGDNFSDGSLPH
jgi:hypothetical protein